MLWNEGKKKELMVGVVTYFFRAPHTKKKGERKIQNNQKILEENKKQYQ
jgi:hypothetical protein